MKCKLAVAAALYAKCLNYVYGRRAQHLIFLVRKRQRRSDDYAVTCVYADRVKVFHAAYGYAVAVLVAHDLELYFLPAGYALFNKHLRDRRETKTVGRYLRKLVPVLGDTAAGAA